MGDARAQSLLVIMLGAICGFTGAGDKNLIKSMCCPILNTKAKKQYYIDENISLASVGIGEEANIVKNGDMIAAFLGQIYNSEILKQRLDRDTEFNLTNDAKLILELFHKLGSKAFGRLIGSFVCAIWDNQKHTLTIARDQFGQNSLYYCLKNDKFYFASDIKSLLCVEGLTSGIDRESLNNYLLYGYVPPPKTLFLNLYKLFAASLICIQLGGLKESSLYWNLKCQPEFGSEDQAIDSIYRKLLETVRLGISKHNEFALFLSGGFDSSLLASLIRKFSNGHVNAYTFVDSNENSYSPKFIADLLDLQYNPVTLSPREAIKIFPILPKIYCDLIADPFVSLPTYVLCKAAQHEPAVFAADNSDNVFWGLTMLYNNFNLIKKLQQVPVGLRRFLLGITKYFETRYPYQRSFYNMLMASISSEPYLYVGRIFINQEIRRLIQGNNFHSHRNIHFNKAKNRMITLNDFYSYNLATAPYRTTNIARIGPLCRSFCLKLFEPFLDVELIQLAQKIPVSLKQPSKTRGKLILKKISEKYKLLPTDFYPRKKGLACPLDNWYMGEFREWVHQTILEELPSFINRRYVTSLLRRTGFVDRFYKNMEDYRTSTRDIFSLLMLALWSKEYAPEID